MALLTRTARATAVPKHPIVLAHGLFGFSELKVANALPAVQYWHGIRDALVARGATVFTPAVPPSSAIEDRAVELARGIAAAAAQLAGQQPRSGGITVNVVAHSMGGLDARYVISRLQPPEVHVASLTTIATPHRGSAFADYVLRPGAGPLYVPHFYRLLSAAGLGTAAFEQLTRSYMSRSFNPRTPDQPSTRYFSFGAVVDEPPVLSPFRVSQRVIAEAEGPNDGLVSVESARWGEYKGTLMGVSHLDLINWTNRVKWTFKEWLGWQRDFNAVSFYLDIMDMLAREGL